MVVRGFKHGCKGHPAYNTWVNMRQKCFNEKYSSFKYYGALGITICDEWLNTPVKFIEWAENNGYAERLHLCLIDRTKNFSPDNCKWGTRKDGIMPNFKHGYESHSVYSSWQQMKDRCFNPKSRRFNEVGGLGITVCEEWLESKNFIDWALANGYDEGKALYCKDITLNFSPNNCFWADKNSGELGSSYKHGLTKCRIHNIWIAMRFRCSDITNVLYCGRGITVCQEWQGDFLVFHEWSMSHGYSEDLSIERVDVNGNYEPSNCKWATDEEQNNNTRGNRIVIINGSKYTVTQAAREFKIVKPSTIYDRLNYGWSDEDAVLTPKDHIKGSRLIG